MKQKFVIIAALLIALLAPALGGCGLPVQTKTPLGHEFTLGIGQRAVITGENITIDFITVTSDSRCPQGVTCIWAGEVSCTVEINRPGKAPLDLELTQSGGSGPAQQEFDDHVLAFSVSPYPQAGKKIPLEDYRLTMTVNKTSQTDAVIEPAPINNVQIATTLSKPPEVIATIQGGLRDTCTTFYSLNTTRSGSLITINVYNKHLTGQICGQVYTFFDKTVNLGSNFVSGQTYTINVNDKATNFTMP